jgi:hypothetical protein
MSEPTPNPHTLLVHVHDGRWDAYGDSTLNPRQQYLYGILVGMGGVNHSVPEGWHVFNVEDILEQKIATLEPYQE